jgi:hypothetical protein
LPAFCLKLQSPSGFKAIAARVFHRKSQAIATAVFDFNQGIKGQVLAPLVFNFNNDAIEQAAAPEVFNQGRRDFAPILVHPVDLVPACDCVSSGIPQTQISLMRYGERGLFKCAHFGVARDRSQATVFEGQQKAMCTRGKSLCRSIAAQGGRLVEMSG